MGLAWGWHGVGMQGVGMGLEWRGWHGVSMGLASWHGVGMGLTSMGRMGPHGDEPTGPQQGQQGHPRPIRPTGAAEVAAGGVARLQLQLQLRPRPPVGVAPSPLQPAACSMPHWWSGVWPTGARGPQPPPTPSPQYCRGPVVGLPLSKLRPLSPFGPIIRPSGPCQQPHANPMLPNPMLTPC
jgi:hypothetical protein